MRTFKDHLLLEYLTDEQKKIYSQYKMTPEARRLSDHFFGEGKDEVRHDIDMGYEKSEFHKKLETHLERSIPHEDYLSGKTKDKYGREVSIGKLIKDNNMRDSYSKDREAYARQSKSHYATIVRGLEVAGQTNPESDENHPNGHSWKDGSCKNITDGLERRHLSEEIKHGTVVTRIHDHNGQEIYRATHQPHFSKDGKVMFDVNSEYGLKHPAFTRHAYEVASRLSQQVSDKELHKLYRIHHKVYDDGNSSLKLHTDATPDHVRKVWHEAKNSDEELAAIQHHTAPEDIIDKALDHGDFMIKEKAVKHKNATHANIMKALDHQPIEALDHDGIDERHLEKVLHDKNYKYSSRRGTYYGHSVLEKAIAHPKVTKDQFDRKFKEILNDKSLDEHIGSLLKSKHFGHEHIDKILDHPSTTSREAKLALSSKKVSKDNIRKALESSDEETARHALKSDKVDESHIDHALRHPHWSVREAGAGHAKALPHQIHKALDDEDSYVRQAAVENSNATIENLKKASLDENPRVKGRAVMNMIDKKNRS